MAIPDDRVVPLHELPDYRVSSEDPDVRGWAVVASDGEKIGTVDTLLVDTEAMKVRYLDVDLADGVAAEGAGDDPHILIPIGYAQLDRDDERVRVGAVRSRDVRSLPAYRRGLVLSEYEIMLRERLDGAGAYHAGALEEADTLEPKSSAEKRLSVSEEELVVGKREVPAGELRVEKHVDVEHVRESVPIRHDEVIVERRPAAAGMAAEARIEDGEIHVPLHKEELVVDKRVVPKEEVVVRTRETVENETVEANLRREHVEVNREPRPGAERDD